MPTKSAKKSKGGLVASPPKAKVAKVVQPESEESSSESSESEEEVPVKAVAKATAASIKKTAPPKDSDDDDDSSDDSEESSSEEDSSEDEKPAVKAPAKTAVQKKPAPKDESSEESDDDSEDEKPVAKKAAAPKAAPAKKAAADSDDSSEEDDSEDEKPVAKKATPKAAPAKKAVPAKKAAADSDDSSEEDDSEDEKPVAKKATPKAAPAKKAVPAKKAAAGSDDDSEEDDSEDDSEEEEPKAKPVAKKTTPVKAAQSDSDESDSDEDESEEEEPPKPPVLTATVSNAKGVTEKQLKKFFKTKGIKVKQIVKANKKSFTVDFQSAGDTLKAVDLSGQEVGGRSVKIEAEAPPAPASPKKAEKKAAKRPAPADDEEEEEEESEEEEEESEEEEVAGKRKKGGDAGAVAKKQKVDTSATEEVVTLFVGRLNNDTTAEAVKKLFKKNGIKCKDVRKMDRKRFGYVDLANAEDLDKAIALSGQELDGSEITVERAKPKNQSFSEPKGQTQQYAGRQERDTSADDRTLFVKGLADSVDEGKLQAFFSEASEVRLPQKEGYHRGFAYIVFPDKETAATVLSEKQGADLEGNALYLDYTGSKSSFKPRERSFNDSYGSRDGGDRRKSTGERGSSNVLFVKNLSFHLDEEGLKDAFPNATTARIAKFPDTQKPKGFGFVEFSSPDDAASAYDTMQNAEIDGRQVFLDFASPGGGRGRGGRGGFGDRGGRGGRGGFGGRGGYGDRGGFRGGRGGFRGGRGGGFGGEPQNKRKKFDDSD